MQTPRTLRGALTGYGERLAMMHKLAMSQAWHAGVIAKSKDTPSLKQLFGESEPADPKAAMRAALKSWTAATRHLGDQAGGAS